MDELLRLVDSLQAELTALRAENAVLRAKDAAELKAQVAELNLELARRKKGGWPRRRLGRLGCGATKGALRSRDARSFLTRAVGLAERRL
jgi:ribosomal protein L29